MNRLFDEASIDWDELATLYRIAPLGDKSPKDLRLAFSNSRFKCLVFDDGRLVGAGRALADGIDCSYLCDIVVHPGRQGRGIGGAIIEKLKDLSSAHRKIILYAQPGKETFYSKLGFKRMRTAMAIFHDQGDAARRGLII